MNRARLACGVGALVGFGLLAIGLAVDPSRALFGYLFAYALGVSLALGALVLLLIAHVSKAGWLAVIRRPTEAIAGTLPAFAVMFIPILIGMSRLYPWTDPYAEAHGVGHLVEHKSAYLNVPFFVVRSLIYLGVFVGVEEVLRRWSLRADDATDASIVVRSRKFAAAMIPVLAFAITFAAFDWLMSLEPGWYSTMYGFYFFAGGFVGAVGLLACMVRFIRRGGGRLGGVLTEDHDHALGRVLFAFTVFWAYIAFGQLVIIWIADIPEEVTWYARRVTGSWAALTYLLVLGHFIVPFFALLPRATKRDDRWLAAIGAWIVLAHLIDVYWLVLPAHDRLGMRPHWIDLGALLAVVGVAAFVAMTRFYAAAPLPVRDPNLLDGIRYEAAS